MKKNQGVTLIAIVITIVVLLILASISIGMLTGNSDIIDQSYKSKENTEISEEQRILNEASVLASNKNTYGNIEKEILQEILDNKLGNNKTNVTNIGTTIFVTFNETQRTYAINNNGEIVENKELEEAIIMRDFITKSNIDRKSVEKIIFTDEKDVETSVEVYDISQKQNDTVRMWILDEDSNEQYEVYIGANYRIIANENMSDFFKNFQKCVSIEGLQYLDTSSTTSMDGMFWGCQNLENLDVSNFNTSKVTNMSNLFVNCYKIKKLDVSKWDTSNVLLMIDTFRDMVSLEEIDVSNFNTSKVTNMSGMFQDCVALTELDLSNFDTSNVTDMSRLFNFSKNLLTIDISSFDFSNVISYEKMFSSVQSKAIIYVNSQSDIDWINNNPSTSATIEIKN